VINLKLAKHRNGPRARRNSGSRSARPASSPTRKKAGTPPPTPEATASGREATAERRMHAKTSTVWKLQTNEVDVSVASTRSNKVLVLGGRGFAADASLEWTGPAAQSRRLHSVVLLTPPGVERPWLSGKSAQLLQKELLRLMESGGQLFIVTDLPQQRWIETSVGDPGDTGDGFAGRSTGVQSRFRW